MNIEFTPDPELEKKVEDEGESKHDLEISLNPVPPEFKPEISITIDANTPTVQGEISVTGYLEDRMDLIRQVIEARDALQASLDTTRDFS